MLLGQLHRQVPLVEEDAAVDGFLRIAELYVGIYGLFAKSHRLELFTEFVQDWRLLRQRVNHIGQVGEVFHLVVSDSEALMVVR